MPSPSSSRIAASFRRGIELLAALGAAASGGLHLAVLYQHTHGTLVISMITAAMALGCLRCAVELARHPGLGAWLTTALMNAMMLILHQPSAPAATPSGHHHSDLSTAALPPQDGFGLMDVVILCAAAELTIAVAAILLATRHNGPERLPVENGVD